MLPLVPPSASATASRSSARIAQILFRLTPPARISFMADLMICVTISAGGQVGGRKKETNLLRPSTLVIKKDAKQAAVQGKAIAAGVKQGLSTPDKPVNINTASKTKLQVLPGIDEETAGRIIKGRPYHTTDEVGAKGAVSPEQFNAIKDKIVVH